MLRSKTNKETDHGGDDTSNNNAKNENNKDEIINALKARVESLEQIVLHHHDQSTTYYARDMFNDYGIHTIPDRGMPANHVAEIIDQIHCCDFNPRLNTSSYVNVVSEVEERNVAAIGATINIADASVYPASLHIHDTVVNMLAKLWHAPEPKNKNENYSGSGTVGSTEACLLAGLALKFRWRQWYGRKIGKSPTSEHVLGVRPNLVISSCYQAAWEKFFRYFDVIPKFCKPNLVDGKNNSMVVDPVELCSLCDDKTIGVVAILGNHYNGAYDPVWDIDKEIKKVNAEKGLQVGVHIDAASGGFVAPFQDEMDGKPFDFRLETVLSMSASGHKFGESVCGTGWVVFRRKEDLAEHIAVTVTYLGGHCDSMTLNFSRPASGVYVQYYKLLRLGSQGYRAKVKNQMKVAAFLRDYLRNEKHVGSGKPYFQILDGGDTGCLPVVAARINPELMVHYDDIDLQHALAESHWYVSGYTLGFEDPCGLETELPLFKDAQPEDTMFRIVVKSNLTMDLAHNLKMQFEETLPILDAMQDGYLSVKGAKDFIEEELHDVPHRPDLVKLASQRWISQRTTSSSRRLSVMSEQDDNDDGGGTPSLSRSSILSRPSNRRRSSAYVAC